jgi:hypothetical protein
MAEIHPAAWIFFVSQSHHLLKNHGAPGLPKIQHSLK